MINSMPIVISTEENEEIAQVVTKKEVYKAIFFMKAYKSPRPNSFPLVFFQHFWYILILDILWVARDFF